MRALKVKTDDAGVIILCSCGNLLYVAPEELSLLDKMSLVCEKCNAEILVTRDNEICSGQDL